MRDMFTLSKKEQKKTDKFIAKHGACGDYYYIFQPTGIGMGFGMSCSCGKSKDMTDVSKW
tara:strand:+ start:539 stop:718 length:180 start_codon:yes stop_codon:yes gene_type:complete